MVKISFEAEKRMSEMYKRGLSMDKIAKVMKVSSGTVHLHLKKIFPEKERKQRQHKPTYSFDSSEARKFKELYRKGYSSIKIAKKYNTTSGIVLYALRKLNVDTSKNGIYRPKIDSKKLAEIRRIYENTNSILETAGRTGLHPSSIHYRLSKLGVVKKKRLNQKIVKQKYEILTNILKSLFIEMGFDIRYIQDRYNGHGPDMIVDTKNGPIIIEHKATIKRSLYWKHAIGEAKKNMKQYDIKNAWIITTASKPNNVSKINEVKLIFLEDLKNLLKKHGLAGLIHKTELISNTPSI